MELKIKLQKQYKGFVAACYPRDWILVALVRGYMHVN